MVRVKTFPTTDIIQNASKVFRIDDKEEKVEAYGWNCDGNNIVGYYVLTENYLLNYNMKEVVQKVEPR